MSDDLKEIGKRIREIRGEHSLEDFEKIIGVSKNTLSLYERGEGNPKTTFLLKLSEYGKVSVNWIVTGKEITPPIVCEQSEAYNPNSKTDEETINDHLEQIIEGLEKQGVERVIAEKMLEATIREARITGTGPDGYINLGDFLKDAKRRLEKEAAHQGQAAEGET